MLLTGLQIFYFPLKITKTNTRQLSARSLNLLVSTQLVLSARLLVVFATANIYMYIYKENVMPPNYVVLMLLVFPFNAFPFADAAPCAPSRARHRYLCTRILRPIKHHRGTQILALSVFCLFKIQTKNVKKKYRFGRPLPRQESKP